MPLYFNFVVNSLTLKENTKSAEIYIEVNMYELSFMLLITITNTLTKF